MSEVTLYTGFVSPQASNAPDARVRKRSMQHVLGKSRLAKGTDRTEL